MSATTLWNRIQHYNSAKAIELKGHFNDSDDLIIRTLERFNEKNSYAGHASGDKSSGTNSSADGVRSRAIEFLMNNVPATAPVQESTQPSTSTSSTNHNAKAQSINRTNLINRIIQDAFDGLEKSYRGSKTPSTLTGELLAADPNWKNIRGAENSVEIYKNRRNEARANKR